MAMKSAIGWRRRGRTKWSLCTHCGEPLGRPRASNSRRRPWQHMWSQPLWPRTKQLARLALGLGSFRFAASCPDDDMVDLRVRAVCENKTNLTSPNASDGSERFPGQFLRPIYFDDPFLIEPYFFVAPRFPRRFPP
eukprot:8638529-Heterocapsa_arctica.AAC.1